MDNITIDPEFQAQIPALSEDEFRLLEENILSEGTVRDPLVVWNGILVDGHNRYSIIQKHPDKKIIYSTYEMSFDNRYAAIAWICKNQLGRRNLTPENWRYLLGIRYEAEKTSQGGDHKSGKNNGSNGHDVRLIDANTADRIAKEHNVSERTVRRAGAFSKGVDIANTLVPGVKEEILSGKRSSQNKVIERLGKAGAEERDQYIPLLKIPPSSLKKGKATTSNIPESTTAYIPSEPTKDNVETPQKILEHAVEMDAPEEDQLKYMLNEITSALEDFVKRWNDCTAIYARLLSRGRPKEEFSRAIRKLEEYTHQLKEVHHV